jgi:hypothetical protein
VVGIAGIACIAGADGGARVKDMPVFLGGGAIVGIAGSGCAAGEAMMKAMPLFFGGATG